MKKFFRRKRYGITAYSKRDVLDQVCYDLLYGLPENAKISKKITLYCGIHNNLFPLFYIGRGIKVGIQTEPLFDENNNIFRRATSWRAIKNINIALKKCDHILDMNEANSSFYMHHPLKHKVTCGPHFFPHEPQPHRSGKKVVYYLLER